LPTEHRATFSCVTGQGLVLPIMGQIVHFLRALGASPLGMRFRIKLV
jgi:hypothetical protein